MPDIQDLATVNNSIDCLPNEILLHVFSYLPIIDIKHRIALVCKRWESISTSASLLDDIYFGPNQPTEVVLRVLQGAPLLKKLRLFFRSDVNDVLREATTSNRLLINLKISSSKEGRYSDVEADVLLEFIKAAKGLRQLTLKRVALDRPEVVFRELGGAAPMLKALNVNHSIQLDTALLQFLVNGIPKLRDIRIYCLSYNHIGSVTPYTNGPVEELLLKMADSLECLKLNMLGLTDSVMHPLSAMSCLKTLHLYRLVNVQDESFVLLSRLCTLKTLVVTVPRTITADCWCQLFGSPGMGSLTSITVSNSYSLDDSVLQIISANCPHLMELSVPGCRRLTDTGVTHIVISCRHLKRLNLFSTKSVVCQAFMIIPSYLPDIELLIYKPVDANIFTIPPELEALPNLVIKSIYRYL